MSMDIAIRGVAETETTVLANTTTTTLLVLPGEQDAMIDSILYACGASGDTLTLDTYDGTTARRLRQVAISANADAAFSTPFVLKRGETLRGTLTIGNSTVVRVNYALLST